MQPHVGCWVAMMHVEVMTMETMLVVVVHISSFECLEAFIALKRRFWDL